MYSFKFKHKSIKITIKSIFGFSLFYTKLILKKLGYSYNLKLINLNNLQVFKLINFIELVPIIKEDELKKYNFSIFQNWFVIKTTKYDRLTKGLPIRGQRTHTNAKTSKKKLIFKSSYI